MDSAGRLGALADIAPKIARAFKGLGFYGSVELIFAPGGVSAVRWVNLPVSIRHFQKREWRPRHFPGDGRRQAAALTTIVISRPSAASARSIASNLELCRKSSNRSICGNATASRLASAALPTPSERMAW